MNSGNDFKNYVTAKNVSRLTSILLIIFYFIPAFKISFDFLISFKKSISAFHGTFGASVRMYGEKTELMSGNFLGIFLLLLPVAMLVMWCLKSALKDQLAALISGICGIVDFIAWLIFLSIVKGAASEALCDFRITIGFIFIMLFLLVDIAANVLMLLGVVQPEVSLLQPGAFGKATIPPMGNMGFPGQQMQGQPGQQMNNYQSAPQQAAPWGQPGQQMNTYQSAPQQQAAPQQTAAPQQQAAAPVCPKCGAPLVAGNKFCTKCGNPVA